MSLYTIRWHNDAVVIIDQTLLPGKLLYARLATVPALCRAIKQLKVRGAPALGAAAALGVYLGIRGSRAKDFAHLYKDLKAISRRIGASRPTARNLFWGLERMEAAAQNLKALPVPAIKKALLAEAQDIVEEDRKVCRAMGAYGASLIKPGTRVLTVCNAGSLATIDYGTALGVIYSARAKGTPLSVYACETRPLLQGARLTAWELKRHGVDVTLICDNMAADLMRKGKVDMVITGADRIAANGDAANKIGTYMLAVAARHHHIPFYVAAPASTFDLSLPHGRKIVIEERDPSEVTTLFYKTPMAPAGVKVYNPAFDVTPHGLITGIITEKGIVRAPYTASIRRALGEK